MHRHETAPGERRRQILTLSAASEIELRTLAERHAGALERGGDLAEVCRRASLTYTGGAHRLAVTGAVSSDVAAALTAFVAAKSGSGLVTGVAASRPKLAFLFTGQGSQYAGMGRELYETQPGFRRTLDACNAALRGVLDAPLLSVLFGEAGEGLIDQTMYTQPVLFALEYGLAELWRTWGIEPDLVMGHSVGEYVAACLAGVFSLADGIRLITARARLMQSLPAGGKMAAVGLTREEALARIAPYTREISLAAVNADTSVVIAGAGERITALGEALAAEGVKVTPLVVSHAFHSPLLDPILDEFERIAATVPLAPPQKDLVSNLTGALATEDVGTPHYWRRHVREPVLFAAGVRAAYERGVRVFVELGPNPVLVTLARSSLPADAVLLTSLRRRRSDWQQLLDSLAELFVRGISFDPGTFWRDPPPEQAEPGGPGAGERGAPRGGALPSV